jgi:O-methyltransferase involved in polyketide biosynthesis
MLESFESISPTAIVTAYPRMFTDIPYEKVIYEWLSKNCNEDVKLDKYLAPEIEARYKLINKLLENSNITQILELAAGYSSRGLIYSKKGYNYVEMDLENVSKNKINLLNDIDDIPDDLHIIAGNALNGEYYKKCDKYFNKDKEIAVINEGLLRYLTFEEKEYVAKNVYNLLKKHGGVWITCDVTPKKFIEKQDECLPNFNDNLNTVTSRNNLKDRFEDINHIKDFMKNIGFNNVEIHKFIEMKDKLKSFEILNVEKNKYDELLENAIVAVISI